MSEEIKEIDEEHIAIIETTISERLVAKSTLEAQKEALLQQIAGIDELLTHFKAPA